MGKRPKLTDKERKKIIADFILNGNKREVARINKVSEYMVRKVCKENEDDIEYLIAQKERDNTQGVLEYMEEQNNTKKKLIDNILKAMQEKTTNIDFMTSIRDLATAYGIIIDKEIKLKDLDIKRAELEKRKAELGSSLAKLDELLEAQNNAKVD